MQNKPMTFCLIMPEVKNDPDLSTPVVSYADPKLQTIPKLSQKNKKMAIAPYGKTTSMANQSRIVVYAYLGGNRKVTL